MNHDRIFVAGTYLAYNGPAIPLFVKKAGLSVLAFVPIINCLGLLEYVANVSEFCSSNFSCFM